jgi:hypothetical protein
MKVSSVTKSVSCALSPSPQHIFILYTVLYCNLMNLFTSIVVYTTRYNDMTELMILELLLCSIDLELAPMYFFT